MSGPTGMPRPRLGAVTAALVAVLLTATGCQGAFDLPLPGGAAARGDIFRVTAEFTDVLDLVPQSSVKVDQVTVGSVEKIELNGWTARVTMRLPRSLDLPDNAMAELKQTSLLGEKYVELSRPPATAPKGHLGEGDNIPLDRTSRNPEVEEVLSALSLLLNGGGVAQLKVIETELNNALRGNEAQIKDVIKQLDIFVSGLDKQKSEIVRAIDNIDKLSARLAAQRNDLAAALESMPQGLKVLADQRAQLVQMLQALSRLGAVGTKVIQASKADTAANLQALQPILAQLNAAGDNLPKALELLLTYPFTDSAVTSGMKGDYSNLYITADLDLRNAAGNLGLPTAPPTGSLPKLPPLDVPDLPLDPNLPIDPKVPDPGDDQPLCPPVCLAPQGQSTSGDDSWRSLYGSES